jgi:hypothetical protein
MHRRQCCRRKNSSMEASTATIKYIDPLIDFAFKKIFGTEPNKDLLIALLNEILRGKKHIRDLVYNQTEFPGELATEGSVFLTYCAQEIRVNNS